jgi:hypothetical protein
MASGGAGRVRGRRGAKRNTTISTIAAAVAAFVGVCEMGPIGSANDDDRTPILSFADFERVYGSFTLNAKDLPLAVKSYFDEVGENSGARVFISRIVHCTTLGDPTTRTSAKGTLYLLTASISPTAGSVTSDVGTFDLEPGQTLVIDRDGSGTATATFNATAAARESANGETFALTNGMTLQLAIDGGATVTKTFATAEFVDIGAATAEEVAAALNAWFLANGYNAIATTTSAGAKVTITSKKRGFGSGINIVGGTANAELAFTTGNVAGTGTSNLLNIDAVTVAEAKTIIEAAVSGVTVTNVGGAAKITSNTTGASSKVQVTGASTAVDFGFDNAAHFGLAGTPANTVLLTAKWDGAYVNDFTTEVTAATNGDTSRRNLILYKSGIEVERWENWNLVTTDPLYLITLINSGAGTQKKSRYVTAAIEDSGLDAPDNLPASATVGPFTGGDDGLTSISDADFYGGKTDNGATGLRCFDKIEVIDDIAGPGRTTASFQNQLVTYCNTTREQRSFAVLGSASGHSVAQVRTYVRSTASLKGLSEVARFVYPRIYVDNPAPDVYGSSATILAPNEGAVMGMQARVSGIGPGSAFEQAAGQELGYLQSVRGIETMEAEDFGKRGLLQDDNINVIRSKEGVPHYVDGSECLDSDGEFATTGESRGVVFVFNQVIQRLEPTRDRNINEALYSRYQNAANDFFETLTDAGRFRSRVYSEAFYVDIGPGLNPDSAVDAKEVNIRFGLNTSPNAKFINFEVVKFRPAAA